MRAIVSTGPWHEAHATTPTTRWAAAVTASANAIRRVTGLMALSQLSSAGLRSTLAQSARTGTAILAATADPDDGTAVETESNIRRVTRSMRAARRPATSVK